MSDVIDNNQATFTRGEAAEEIPLGDQIALYNMELERAVLLNETGALIWEELETPQSIATLSQRVADEFAGVDREQVTSDVRSYLEELLSHELVMTEKK